MSSWIKLLVAGRFTAAVIYIVIGHEISRDFELCLKVRQKNYLWVLQPCWAGSWHFDPDMRAGLVAHGLFSTLNIRQRKLRAKNAVGSGVGQRSRSR